MLGLAFSAWLAAAIPAPHITCSILVYHRFGPTVADSMATRTAVLEQQLAAMRAHGYHIAALPELVDVLQGRTVPSASMVAITVDDGHRTVYTELYPLLQRQQVPVTLFIYPSAIGKAPYAMTWEQLGRVAAMPGVEIGSHTYWHPDFNRERSRLTAHAYTTFVAMQLERPRMVLRDRLGVAARYLAWPYGINDAALQGQARASGYAAAFALGERNASAGDQLYALPRHLITDADGVHGLLARLAGGPACMP